MTLWLIRGGRNGEFESEALDTNRAIIEWGLPDLSSVRDRETLRRLLAENYPGESAKRLSNWESQLWPFLQGIREGDLIALPLKTRGTIAVGRVTGTYEKLRGDLHGRPVQWFADIPREKVGQDLLYSLGAFMTVCRIERNEAETRITALANGGSDPGLSPTPGTSGKARGGSAEVADETSAPGVDLTAVAEGAIQQRINAAFKGHGLSRLIGAILETQGYHVRVSPAGPDGGVDVLAGRGALGFDAPRLVVQVKSQDTPLDVSVLRELQGVMHQFSAEQGLLVAWGGVKRTLEQEAQRLFFQVRLWDAADVVRGFLESYERLPEDIQAIVPCKRIWVLADEL
ncbi:MAG TPA: restriction endonuclease [Allosphingosinicella sp.]|jgi:restriction system protein